MKKEDINYRKEVFLHPWNLWFLGAGLTGALGISLVANIAAAFPFILIVTFGLELFALGTIPANAKFRKMVEYKYARERAKPSTSSEIFWQLGRASQRRYVHLRELQKKIEVNYQKLGFASQPLIENHIDKLDQLLASSLTLLLELDRQVKIREGLKEEDLLSAMATLRREVQQDAERIRNIKLRRLKVLNSRLERYRKSHEQLQVIEAQLATIEDVVMYIHEKSLTMRDPEEITYQLDILLADVGNTEEAVSSTEEMYKSPTNFGELDVDWLDMPVEQVQTRS